MAKASRVLSKFRVQNSRDMRISSAWTQVRLPGFKSQLCLLTTGNRIQDNSLPLLAWFLHLVTTVSYLISSLLTER